jgi:hypothetical protein
MQSAWAHENGVPITQHTTPLEVVCKQVDALQPDILYCSDPITYDSRFVRMLKKRPSLVVGWRAASIPAWSDFTAFDLILSNEAQSRQTAIKHGADATEYFFPAFPEWIAQAVADEPKRYDLVFCGQITAEHMRRAELVEQLAMAAQQTGAFTPAFFLKMAGNWNFTAAAPYIHAERWGLDFFREIRRGRVGFNNVIDFAHGEAGNMRQFEVAGTGTMLLTPDHPSITQHFVPGKEVEVYTSFEDLVEKVIYYRTHDEEREAIAQRGQQRCFKEHGLSVRSLEFLDLCSKYLRTAKITRQLPTEKPAQQILEESAAALNANKPEEGYLTALKALKYHSAERNVHYLLGYALLRLNRIVEAVEALSVEVSRFPDNQHAGDLYSQVRAITEKLSESRV